MQMISRGNTAEVFLYSEGKILKLYKPGYDESIAQDEYRRAKFIAPFPFPKPQVYEYITVDGRPGIVYEKIDGISLENWALERRDIDGCAAYLAALHEKILACRLSADQGDSYKDMLFYFLDRARAAQDVREMLKERLRRLPEGDRLCHGDYHLGNVILRDGQETVIDFLNICRGPRLYDIARSYYLSRYTPVSSAYSDREELLRLKTLLADLYLEKMQVCLEEIQPYLELIAAARTAECPEEEADFPLTAYEAASKK